MATVSEVKSHKEEAPGSSSAYMAALCIGLGAILAAVGLGYAMIYSNADRLVGGDAYNMIILAQRGTAIVCCGVASACIGIVWALFSIRYAILSKIAP